MKTTKRALALVLALVMVFSLAVFADAATMYNGGTLTKGEWKNVYYNNGTTYYYYKISVPTSSYVTFYIKNSHYNSGTSTDYNTIDIYKSVPTTTSSYDKYLNFFRADAGATRYIYLAKGTYYIRVNNACTLKYKTTTTNFGSSQYNKGKAVSLAKDTTKVAVQNSSHTNMTWYKIKLSSNQRITYYTDINNAVTIYDSKYNKVKFDSYVKSGYRYKYVSSSKMASGTYYVCLGQTLSSLYYDVQSKSRSANLCYPFCWK